MVSWCALLSTRTTCSYFLGFYSFDVFTFSSCVCLYKYLSASSSFLFLSDIIPTEVFWPRHSPQGIPAYNRFLMSLSLLIINLLVTDIDYPLFVRVLVLFALVLFHIELEQDSPGAEAKRNAMQRSRCADSDNNSIFWFRVDLTSILFCCPSLRCLVLRNRSSWLSKQTMSNQPTTACTYCTYAFRSPNLLPLFYTWNLKFSLVITRTRTVVSSSSFFFCSPLSYYPYLTITHPPPSLRHAINQYN